jgi:hypothetical protein
MTFKEFIEKKKRYIDVAKSGETADSYVIHLKKNYSFYHWTPRQSYSKQTISIDKKQWNNGVAGDTIMDGFYDLSPNDKIKTLTGICLENTNGELMTLTPSVFAGFEIDYLNWAWVQDNKDAYYRKAGRAKSDDSAKQGGIGATKRKKEQAITWVFAVNEIKDISEKSGLPIFAKGFKVRVKRVNEDSARNYVKSMYSYKKTGKYYFVELHSTEK